MLSVTYRKHGIRLTHIWFATDEEIRNKAYKKGAGDLIFLHGSNVEPDKGVNYSHQLSLIKDLRPDEDEIFLSLGKHLRQYIKRSAKEQLAEIRIYNSEEILSTPSVLADCKVLFEKMYKDKGMDQTFNTNLAEMYLHLNVLSIAVAYNLDKKAIGFSAVIHHEKNARLWVAAFDFRNDTLDSQMLSRAHQRLDWELICYCKKIGLDWFDFGGVVSFDEPDGISQFKLKFESENKVEYDNYLIPNNILGKAALKFYLK